MKKLIVLILAALLFINFNSTAQYKRSDHIKQTDNFGFTTMAYFNYANWSSGKNRSSMKFDSFRIWGQTDLSETIFASVQYRFYEGWRTPAYMYIGWNINKKNTLKLGQIWVPFGFEFQTWDDWGNLDYYMGFQDDYDYGIGWQGKYGIFNIYAYYLMNQQLSSSSSQRLDTDIYSGDAGPDNLFEYTKKNEEKNQFNFMFEAKPSGDNWDITTGLSLMAGQLYNQTTEKYGSRFAGALHFGIESKNIHFNVQETIYKFTQQLPDTATQDMKDFLNVSSWNFAYEIPSSASIFTTAAAYDIIGQKLTSYLSYSYVSGGTTQAVSQLLVGGVSTIWRLFQIYGEVHYGVNDPQLSGNATGYGRNDNVSDIGFQIRVYYTMAIVNKSIIERIKNKK